MRSPPESRSRGRRAAWGGLALLVLLGVPAGAQERPLVVLFGGYGATPADMAAWARAAARHPVYGRAFAFEGIAYPSGVDSRPGRAVAAAADTLAEVTARLRIRGLERRRTIVAGHSSGAALAVTVVTRLAAWTPVKLISLDAGINTDAPAPDTPPIGALECWSAAGADGVSFGFRRTRELCHDHFYVLRSPRCATPVCLHFYLVNREADPDLTFARSRALRDGLSGGYQGLSVNLDWLAHSL